jgi:hypothetical protein
MRAGETIAGDTVVVAIGLRPFFFEQ